MPTLRGLVMEGSLELCRAWLSTKQYPRGLPHFTRREHVFHGDPEALEQPRRGLLARLADAMYLVACARQRQHRDRFRFRVDDPVFGNLRPGINAAFLLEIALPSVRATADDLHDQVGSFRWLPFVLDAARREEHDVGFAELLSPELDGHGRQISSSD